MNVLLFLLVCQCAGPRGPDADLEVSAFLSVECPLARLYARRLNELQAEFPQVQFRAYAPNRQDGDEQVADLQKLLDFPLQKGTAEALRLGATRSPEVFLIQAARVVYSGRIDDQYAPGKHRIGPTRCDLAAAIREILSGQRVTVPRSEPEGCHLNIEVPSIGQAADALAVMHAKCATCHHPGTAAPFSLLTSDQARDWRATIRDVLTQGRMPPWGADVGEFANDRRLSANERQVLLAWLDAGCPQGDERVPPTFSDGWSFTPDLVQETLPFQVPATGTLDYQEFRLPIFSRDTWVSAVEMRGSRAVHHINALLEPVDADPSRRYIVGGDDYLATMVAGNRGIQLPPGMAKLIPAHWRIKLEIHYEPIGQPILDTSAIALKFSDKPRKRVITQMLLKQDIVLQPNELATFHQEWRLDKDYTLLAIFPHMHLRGKSMRVEAWSPNQPMEVLLDVPRYDYAWQDRYVLAAPRSFPAGTVFHVTAQWDNTRDNPINPDPNQTVGAGRRAVDEMFQCALDVFETGDAARAPSLWMPVLAIAVALVYVRICRRN